MKEFLGAMIWLIVLILIGFIVVYVGFWISVGIVMVVWFIKSLSDG